MVRIFVCLLVLDSELLKTSGIICPSGLKIRGKNRTTFYSLSFYGEGVKNHKQVGRARPLVICEQVTKVTSVF